MIFINNLIQVNYNQSKTTMIVVVPMLMYRAFMLIRIQHLIIFKLVERTRMKEKTRQ